MQRKLQRMIRRQCRHMDQVSHLQVEKKIQAITIPKPAVFPDLLYPMLFLTVVDIVPSISMHSATLLPPKALTKNDDTTIGRSMFLVEYSC